MTECGEGVLAAWDDTSVCGQEGIVEYHLI